MVLDLGNNVYQFKNGALAHKLENGRFQIFKGPIAGMGGGSKKRRRSRKRKSPKKRKSPRKAKKASKRRSKSRRKSSKKRSNPWIRAVQMARKQLGIKGFQPVRKGSRLYRMARDIYDGM